MLQTSSPDVLRKELYIRPDVCYKKACMCTDALFGVAGCLQLEAKTPDPGLGPYREASPGG